MQPNQRQGEFLVHILFITAPRRGRKRSESGIPFRHVITRNFHSVQVQHKTVIGQYTGRQPSRRAELGGSELK